MRHAVIIVQTEGKSIILSLSVLTNFNKIALPEKKDELIIRVNLLKK